MSEDEMRKEENLEHEVLDRLKTLEPIDFDYNVVDGSYVNAMLKARNIILDLYNKEKEKNEAMNKGIDELVREKQEIIQGQENCEHEYVALSKYKLISGRYKIIQKCTKCGKELEEDWGI